MMDYLDHYTMNSGSGPLEGVALTLNFRRRKLAFTEIHFA
jgi:hypothetical protein